MTRVLLVSCGGFLGTGARYLLNGWVAQRFGESFPIGTLAVNVAGSFLIGVAYVAAGPDSRFVVSPEVRQFLAIGVLGGFTTFSSFSQQTLNLLRDGEALAAVANVVLSVVLCVGAAWAGEAFARLVWR